MASTYAEVIKIDSDSDVEVIDGNFCDTPFEHAVKINSCSKANIENAYNMGKSRKRSIDEQTESIQKEIIDNKQEFLRLCRFCLKPGHLSLVQYQLPVTQTFKYIGLKLQIDINENCPITMCKLCADTIKGFSAFIDGFKVHIENLAYYVPPGDDTSSKKNGNMNSPMTCLACLKHFTTAGLLYRHYVSDKECKFLRNSNFTYEYYFNDEVHQFFLQFKCPACTSTFVSDLERKNHVDMNHPCAISSKPKRIKK
ncbi:hypothetical protein NQ314_015304 [Rhamnusium bicolor]|uniref:C2H2-type domain-containing protein n=1 Tax=Rhamnusium bicolor TaxID=1586634 RepID=A0AAV8WZ63_9CUCU|nr:hypothetical protein NQ314_015304 [Rhamnusium bicolor]